MLRCPVESQGHPEFRYCYTELSSNTFLKTVLRSAHYLKPAPVKPLYPLASDWECVPPHSYAGVLDPNAVLFGGEAFKRSPYEGISVLIRRHIRWSLSLPPSLSVPLSLPCDDTASRWLTKPGRGLSPEPKQASTLTLDCRPLELGETNLCYYRHRVYDISLQQPKLGYCPTLWVRLEARSPHVPILCTFESSCPRSYYFAQCPFLIAAWVAPADSPILSPILNVNNLLHKPLSGLSLLLTMRES